MARCEFYVLIYVYIIRRLESCGSYYYEDYDDGTLKPINKSDAYERNVNQAWRGWKQPEHVKKQWRDWMAAYYKKYEHVDTPYNKTKHNSLPERGPGSGWPERWRGLGEGSPGVDPPPWAYVPKNIGKPTVCYRRPLKGPCKQNLPRWGYNPFSRECETYIYSGCLGTPNNFLTKLDCEKKCMQPISSGCDNFPHMYADDLIPADGPG